MLLIDYSQPNFHILLNMPEYDEDAFNDYVLVLKRLYLKYDSKLKAWICPVKQIEETVAWLSKKEFPFQFTNEAHTQYSSLRFQYKREIESFRLKTFDSSVLQSHVELFPCQLDTINKLITSNRWYLADDPGVGKTLESIAVFSQWYKEGSIDGIFIVVRKGLPYHWKHEILDFSTVFKEEDICIINNTSKKQLFEKNQDKKIIIVPNHLLADVFMSYRKDYNNLKSLKYIDWSRPVVNLNVVWNKKSLCCIVDEAHELTNPDAIVTKALFAYKDFFNYRLPLSATPAINYFEKWWSSLHFLDPSLLPMPYKAFKVWLAKEIGDNWDRYKIKSYDTEKVGYVRKILQRVVLKKTKADIPEFKSKKTVKPVFLEMPSIQRELYARLFAEALEEIEGEFEKVTGSLFFKYFPYILQSIDNPLLLRGKLKKPENANLLAQWSFEQDVRLDLLEGALDDYLSQTDKKVLIFDHHPLTLDLLYKRFEKKYHPLIVHGQLNDTEEERNKKVQLFNDLKSSHKIMLLSTDIGGPGLNLHKACSKAIAWSLPFDTVLFEQMQGRIHRITSMEDVVFEILLLDKSLDIYRYKKNIGRVEINNTFLDKTLNEKDIMELFEGTFNIGSK